MRETNLHLKFAKFLSMTMYWSRSWKKRTNIQRKEENNNDTEPNWLPEL